jgi:aminopeptidase YwaD
MNKKVYTKYFFAQLFLFLVFSAFSFYSDHNKGEITAENVISEIKYLASDELGGRFPGTKGDSLAEKFGIKKFKEAGLTPIGDDGYRQKFSFVSEIKAGTNNSLLVSTSGVSNVYKLSDDFIPFGYSSVGTFEGDLVFAGYGINAADLNYNDFKDIDLKDKIAVIFAYSPGYSTPHDNPFSNYEQTRRKCNLVKEAGSKGVIVVTGPNSSEDELAKLRTSTDHLGIPAISVKRAIVEALFKSMGKNLEEFQKNMDSVRTPNSFAFTGSSAKIQVDLQYITANTANIIGYLEGNDPVLKKEVIVVGGHLDHLGDGLKYGSLYDGKDAQIHNGADDNASGSAGVMELAGYFGENRENLKRSYIFMLFNGEEAGLLGSAFFVKSELFKKYNIVAMINMDMVGRLADNKLTIGGVGTSPIWKGMLDSLNNIYKFTAVYNQDGYGPSDHSSFYSKDVPVLFFFTGLHKDYHRPTDKWNLINADGEVKVLDMVRDVMNTLDKMPARPEFVKAKSDNKERSNMGFRVTMGVVPDYSSTAEGLQITGVKSGGPADKAGLLAEDIITKLGDYEIKNIYDYTDALSKFKPGEDTEVVVKRGNEELKLKVTFNK